jgi:hypothetical protein
MITLLGSKRRLCDGMTRRETLKAGALSLLGGAFNLPSLLWAEQNRAAHDRPGKAKSVILLYLLGGAPTQDMFDLKPGAPDKIRGEFKPIASNVPGIQVCEHLPRMARWMHRAALVRSVNHKAGCHNPLASYTGYEVQLPDITTIKDTYPPSMGSVCEYLRKGNDDLPAYIYMPCYPGQTGNFRYPGPYAGFLGKRYDPLFTEHKPAVVRSRTINLAAGAPFLAKTTRLAEGITLDALQTREALLHQFDRKQRRQEAEGSRDDLDRIQQRALSLLTSAKLKAAFDLSATDPRTLDRYGGTLFGSSALIARRLVEAGVRFVNVTWDYPVGDNSWDTHAKNFEWLRGALPSLDATYSALMEDLEYEGLLEETLVVMMSDMGRTPQVNPAAGRDHWSYCYTVVFAGAGIRGGTVCGASDAHAAYVKDRPVSTGDVCATIYQCLGIDPDMPVYDRGDRPVPVAHGGRPIREILA